MELSWGNQAFSFEPVDLCFEEGYFENIFAAKNNKTVGETLRHKRYAGLAEETVKNYPQYLTWSLGKFILFLKSRNDLFYRKFLNKYGDGVYCRFFIEDERFLNKKGLYIYTLSGRLQYIGQCTDSFRRRINQGYGKIHPKNCYIDGQSTDCHLNALIAEQMQEVKFFVHVIRDISEIDPLERRLIPSYNPPWNIALKSK